MSDDGGIIWNYASQGMPFVPVIDFDYGAGFLLAATHGRSIYRTQLATGLDDELISIIPQSFILKQNYPNPFNPVTTLEYQIPSSQFVDLSIYNILGQKVATLVSEKQNAGTQKVQWNATGMSSGLYFCSLKTDLGFSQTRKIILMR